MSKASNPVNARLLSFERLVDFVGIRLDGSDKILQPLLNGKKPAAAVKLQEYVASRRGIEPEIAASLPKSN